MTVYDTHGNILLTENDSGDTAKENATDLSFDKSLFPNLKDGYLITQPHVDTLYKNKYPWVVTIAKKSIPICSKSRSLSPSISSLCR